MKSLMFKQFNKPELLDVPEPQVHPRTVKVKLKWCSICASDIGYLTGKVYETMPCPAFPMGHETCGEIVELGEGADDLGWNVGDKVAINSINPCGVCENCKRGDHFHCDQMMASWATCINNCAEYAVCGLNQIFKIPKGVEDIMPYALLEPVTSAVRAMYLANIRPGDTVAIAGFGGLGSILTNLILFKGAARLTVIEPNAAKRELALAMGAKYVIDPTTEDVVARCMEITEDRGYDVVVEATGLPVSAEKMLDMVANKGTVLFYALFNREYELPVNLLKLWEKEARIQAVITSLEDCSRAMELIPMMQTDKIISKVFPLSEAVEAIQEQMSGKYNKILIDCSKP